jgi:hypothetical protein
MRLDDAAGTIWQALGGGVGGRSDAVGGRHQGQDRPLRRPLRALGRLQNVTHCIEAPNPEPKTHVKTPSGW